MNRLRQSNWGFYQHGFFHGVVMTLVILGIIAAVRFL